MGTILLNFWVGGYIETSQKKSGWNSQKTVFYFGIFSNLFFLAYFKYFDFFITEINKIFLRGNVELLNLTLPIGISFYTFSQITYLVDVWRGRVKSKDLWSYAVFVSFFPALLAGPIVRYNEIIPQLDQLKTKIFNYKNFQKGCLLFSIGLVKRTILSEKFSIWANQGFDNIENLDFLSAWMASLSYTLQIYFDFSGYTDMALGLALLININLPKNFNSPYKAANLQEFWRRWHMTLFRFLRDYFYVPLGGNKEGVGKKIRNIILVFLVAGIWHGAGWSFIAWGILNGFGLILYQLWKRYGIELSTSFAVLVTFNFVNISWVFFRAKNLDEAIIFLKAMLGLKTLVFPEKLIFLQEFFEPLGFSIGSHPVHYFDAGVFLVVGLSLLIFKNSDELIDSDILKSRAFIVVYYIVIIYCLLLVSTPAKFIYFEF
ncbi:MAG: MBOAT family protein [Nitrospina sp.]|nr:MBOAT family protein [Nitrospina sp.]